MRGPLGSNPTEGGCVFIAKATAIYDLEHGRAITAVQCPGQLSLLTVSRESKINASHRVEQ